MADITMCQNKACPCRMECYRYRAIPHPTWQAYAAFVPAEPGVCKYFETTEGRIIRDL